MSVCIAICTCVKSLSVGYIAQELQKKKSAVGVTSVAGVTFRTRTFSKFSSRDIRVSTVILIKFHKVSQGLGLLGSLKTPRPSEL